MNTPGLIRVKGEVYEGPVTVNFTDGTSEIYDSVSDAEIGIYETVVGSDFAATVESVTDEVGDEIGLAVEWSVSLVTQ